MSSEMRKEKQRRLALLNSPFFLFGCLASVFMIMPCFYNSIRIKRQSGTWPYLYIKYNLDFWGWEKMVKKFAEKFTCGYMRIEGDSGSLYSRMIFGSCLPKRLKIIFFNFYLCHPLEVGFVSLYLEYKTVFRKGKKTDRKKWKILQIFPASLQPAI